MTDVEENHPTMKDRFMGFSKCCLLAFPRRRSGVLQPRDCAGDAPRAFQRKSGWLARTILLVVSAISGVFAQGSSTPARLQSTAWDDTIADHAIPVAVSAG